MALTPYYSKAEADQKNKETFREVESTVQSISAGEGGKSFATLADAQAVSPAPSNGTVFQVENSGYYVYDSASTGGTRFLRGFGLKKETVINEIRLDGNLINDSFVNAGTGAITALAGAQRTQWILINSDKEYYISGRVSDEAIVFKDNAGNLMKPVDENGTPNQYYLLGKANGKVIPPNGATFVMITSIYETPLEGEFKFYRNEFYEDYISKKFEKTTERTELITNLINDSYVNAGTGAITALAGAQRTDWIPIDNKGEYYLENRVENNAIVFKDNAGNLMKPVDENGVVEQFYWYGNKINGRIYPPEGAVEVMITTVREALNQYAVNLYNLKIRKSLFTDSISQSNLINDPNFLVVPDVIETFVGDTLQIFKYNICSAYNPDVYNIQAVSDKITGVDYAGDDYANYWQYETSIAENFNLTFYLYDNYRNLIDSKSVQIKVLDHNTQPASNLNVCFVGDSLTFYNRIPDEFARILKSLDTYTTTSDSLNTNTIVKPAGKGFGNISLVGTQKNNYKGWTGAEFHEGYSGETWNDFVSSVSPFYIAGSLNFNQYLTDNAISGIDVMYIGLGWNDIIKIMSTDTDTTSIIENAKTFLRALNSQLPNTKVYLWTENFPSEYGGEGTHPYGSSPTTDMQRWKIRLSNLFIAYQDLVNDAEFSGFVKLIGSNAMFDSRNMMQYGAAQKNIRITNTEIRGVDDVHPSDGGFFQIADSLVRSFIYNHISV